MIVTSEILADVIVELLQAAGVANGAIFGVRAFPKQQDQFPQVQLQLPQEDKQSLSRVGGNQFVVTATLPLVITVQAAAGPGEAGAAAARGQLADIVRHIEATVIGAPDLQRRIQRIAFVRSHPRVDGTGAQILGEAVWMIGLEFYQGPEDFFVPSAVPLETVTVSEPPPPEGHGAQRLLLDDLNPS